MDASELLVRIDERQEAMFNTLQEVLEEAKKTNGRVKALETTVALHDEALEGLPVRVDNLESSRDKQRGAWAALVAVGTIIGGLLGYFLA